MTLAKQAFDILQADQDYIELMFTLFFRWKDEGQYESWDEYSKIMKRDMPKAFKFNSGTKRPFGIKFTYKGVDLQFSVTSSGYKLKTY